MVYIFGIIIFILYGLIAYIFKTEQLMFGLNYIIEFMFIILQYTLDKDFTIPYYEYTLEQIENLRLGYLFHFSFSFLFFVFALMLRAYNPENSDGEVKFKKFFGILIFIISVVFLFAGANNCSEYNRQKNLNDVFDKILVVEGFVFFFINQTFFTDVFNCYFFIYNVLIKSFYY